MTNARENGSGMPQPKTKSVSERTDTTSSDSDHDADKGGVPRWLKIAAVAIPVFATICAGLWTVSSVLMGQYVTLQTSLKQEETKQAASRAAEAESTKLAAEARLSAEKEVTRRQDLLLIAEANARRDEKQLQQLKTDEQQARQTISTNEINRQVVADKTATQIHDDEAFARLIATVSASVGSPDTPTSSVSLAALMRYANNSRYADILAAALVAASARITTLEEAQLCLRVAEAIQPLDFALIAKMNRSARRKVEEGAVRDFWRQYIPHSKAQTPFDFLDQKGPFQVYEKHSLAYTAIRHELSETDYEFQSGPLNIDWSEIAIRKNQGVMLPSVVEANTFLMEHSADTLMRYIMNSNGQGVVLDISGCYFRYKPFDLRETHLVTDKTFFDDFARSHAQ